MRWGWMSPRPHLSEGRGEDFLLDIPFHRMSAMAFCKKGRWIPARSNAILSLEMTNTARSMMRRCVNSSPVRPCVRAPRWPVPLQAARSLLTHFVLLAGMLHDPAVGLRSFPPQYLSGSALSNESATSCFNLPFSSSSSFCRLAWSIFTAPYSLRLWQNTCVPPLLQAWGVVFPLVMLTSIWPQHRHDLFWRIHLDGHDPLFLQVDFLSFHPNLSGQVRGG
jgi:hypothetical protein